MTPSEAQAALRESSDAWNIKIVADDGTEVTDVSAYSGYVAQSMSPSVGTVLDRTDASVNITLTITKSAETLEAERIAAGEAAAAAAEEERRLAEERAARKAAAVPIAYTDLFRAGNTLAGNYYTFEGEIIQDIGEGQYRVNVTKETFTYSDRVMYSDMIQLVIIGDTSTKLLEDDIIQFNAMSLGTYTYKTVLGASMEVLLLTAEAVDVVLIGSNK